MLIKSMACTRVGVLLSTRPSQDEQKGKTKNIKKMEEKGEWGNRFLRRRVLCLRSGWTSGGSDRSVPRRHDDLRRCW